MLDVEASLVRLNAVRVFKLVRLNAVHTRCQVRTVFFLDLDVGLSDTIDNVKT